MPEEDKSPEEDKNPEVVPVKEAAAADADNNDDSLESQLQQARAEASENLDNFLRAKAESENIRRRSADDVVKARKFAIEQLAGELLAVRDSLELAIQASLEGEQTPAVVQMHEGIVLTLKQLDSAFEKTAITSVDPTGEKFNPDYHHAVSMIETDEVAPNHVLNVMQKGYLISDRLLRPAMVVVAKGTNTDTQEGENTGGTETSEA